MKKSKGLYRNLLGIAVIPLVLSGIVIAITTQMTFTETIHLEVQRGLHSVATLMIRTYDVLYPGDYHLEQDGETYRFYKGEKDLTDEYQLLDSQRDGSGIDFTFFFYDMRVLTTLKDSEGNRITGTKAHSNVVKEVFESEKAMFYNRVLVEDERYFAYYTPLYNHDGTCVGMFFAGKPTVVVNTGIKHALVPILVVTVLMIGVSCLICNNYAKELAMVISRIKYFLGELSEGNLKAELDSRIVQRKDELGEMGRFTAYVQKYLKEMVERDSLSKLYSRRIGTKMLQRTHHDYMEKGVPYCLALCDIDFFKNFNDTYGHDCGDIVIKQTADILNQMLLGKGYAIRWGGEEFLLVFENYNLSKAYEVVCCIKEQVAENEIDYKGEDLKITMTYGLISSESFDEMEAVIKAADKLLYEGKERGRNCIIAELSEE